MARTIKVPGVLKVLKALKARKAIMGRVRVFIGEI